MCVAFCLPLILRICSVYLFWRENIGDISIKVADLKLQNAVLWALLDSAAGSKQVISILKNL